MGRECPSCGREAAPQARFCTACGRSLGATSASANADLLAETDYFPVPAPDRPGPRERGAWSRAIVILAVLALVSGSAGAYVGIRSYWHGSGGSGQAGSASSQVGLAGSTTAASEASSAPSAAERAQLRRLTPLIRRSARARVAVAAAVAQAGRCRLKPTRAIGTLRHAITERRAAIRQARRLPTNAIGNGPALVSYLVQALQQSSAADRGFIGWLQDMTGRHSCPVSTAKNHSYQEALLASGRATEAKASFLQLWNPLARESGQPVFTAGRI
jgi:hypothetical protein